MRRESYPTAVIHCPDCGVECNYVANCLAEMPFSYPGTYHPHQKGSRECLERQVWNLKTRIEQLTEEITGKKYLVHLMLADRQAVVIGHTPEEAVQRARLFDPNGGWEHASVAIITRVRESRTVRVLAIEKFEKQEGLSPPALEEIYHAGWAVIVHSTERGLTKTELADLQRLRSALEPIQTRVRVCNPYDAIFVEIDVMKSEGRWR